MPKKGKDFFLSTPTPFSIICIRPLVIDSQILGEAEEEEGEEEEEERGEEEEEKKEKEEEMEGGGAGRTFQSCFLRKGPQVIIVGGRGEGSGKEGGKERKGGAEG